jgi:hypothetical protein
MRSAITLSLMSLGARPRAPAKRARRERPMWARRPESRSNRSTQAGLNGDLPWSLTAITPQAFAAARKSERILARRLVEIPTATGLTAASRVLIAPISSGMAAGSSPSRMATRFTADTRSRRRVAASLPWPSRAVRTPARVRGTAGRGMGAFCRRFLLMRFLLRELRAWPRAVSGGQGVTGADIRELYHKADGAFAL